MVLQVCVTMHLTQEWCRDWSWGRFSQDLWGGRWREKHIKPLWWEEQGASQEEEEKEGPCVPGTKSEGHSETGRLSRAGPCTGLECHFKDQSQF